MKSFYNRWFVISGFLLAVSGAAIAQNPNSTNSWEQAAPNPGFIIGTASVSRLPVVPEINSGVNRVTFQAGARTIWHSHAGGQILVITEGTAYYQEKGKTRQIIRRGDAIICPPNAMHWHGASPDGSMTHVVATPNLDKGGVTSGDPVTEQEYKGGS